MFFWVFFSEKNGSIFKKQKSRIASEIWRRWLKAAGGLLLKNCLRINTINKIRTGNEQLITVVGAGGGRDKTKRPLMAKIATELSDKVILTSDNPRNENPEDIIHDMKEGINLINNKKTLTIINRHEAIKTACLLANTGDIILVAGKGHENYQEINGVKYDLDDSQILKEQFTITTNN